MISLDGVSNEDGVLGRNFESMSRQSTIEENGVDNLTGGATINRGHEHQRSIRCCSARAGRPRCFGGTQRDSGT
jgi:hypothetical protein